MARKRMIDPNIWQSEDFSALSTLAKVVFIGLFSNADDEGRGRAKAAYIKSILFPYDEEMRVGDIDKTLSEIASKMSITFYTDNENQYYSLDNWSKWQKIDRPTASTLPPLQDSSTIIRRVLDEPSTSPRQLLDPNRKEKNITKKKGSEYKQETERAFNEFWEAYPRKVAKADAKKAYMKIDPDSEFHAKMLSAIETAKKSDHWVSENGKYIPYPATWLNKGCWDDEYPESNGGANHNGARNERRVDERGRSAQAEAICGADGIARTSTGHKIADPNAW